MLQSPEALEKLQKCKMSHFGETLAILICVDTKACWKREYDGKTSGDIDAAIVTTHMMLAAQELGIGSTWVMHFIPEAVRAEFEIPDHEEPISLLVMGCSVMQNRLCCIRRKVKNRKYYKIKHQTSDMIIHRPVSVSVG